jgi:hypothetical protein
LLFIIDTVLVLFEVIIDDMTEVIGINYEGVIQLELVQVKAMGYAIMVEAHLVMVEVIHWKLRLDCRRLALLEGHRHIRHWRYGFISCQSPFGRINCCNVLSTK